MQTKNVEVRAVAVDPSGNVGVSVTKAFSFTYQDDPVGNTDAYPVIWTAAQVSGNLDIRYTFYLSKLAPAGSTIWVRFSRYGHDLYSGARIEPPVIGSWAAVADGWEYDASNVYDERLEVYAGDAVGNRISPISTVIAF